mmetsp:Transcript_52977/g.137072  ORF Transcript_52977/g.137072 Transcript_52977/m.137072 type:complete len:92 (+) Transcript_52977:16-291(+)
MHMVTQLTAITIKYLIYGRTFWLDHRTPIGGRVEVVINLTFHVACLIEAFLAAALPLNCAPPLVNRLGWVMIAFLICPMLLTYPQTTLDTP